MSFFRSLLALSASVFATFPAVAESATTLARDQISQHIIGKRLNAKRLSIPVQILYKPDGTVTMKFPFMSCSGTWSFDPDVNDDGVCMMLTSCPRRGRTCVTFERLGGNKYRNSEGIDLAIQE